LQCAVVGCNGETSCQGRGLTACDAQDPPVVVPSLPLSPNTVDYYQVYFSVLAALGPRDATYCPIAMNVAAQVRGSGLMGARPDIAGNMAVAQQECSNSPEPAGSLTPSPGALYSTTSTPFPSLTGTVAPGP
jgi:hypothetical protein